MKNLSILILSIICFSLTGCSLEKTFSVVKPEPQPHYQDLLAIYNQIQLKTSAAAGVLAMTGNPDELLSQTKDVIATQGQQKDTRKIWFNIIGFSEEDLTADAKYLFLVDEHPKTYSIGWKPQLYFDCQVVVDSKTLSQPYSDENAKKIAILKYVREKFSKDAAEVNSDNKQLLVASGMIKQAIANALTSLNSSPAEAANLSTPQGMGFEHISMDKGRIQLVLTDDLAAVKLRLGYIAEVKEFEGN